MKTDIRNELIRFLLTRLKQCAAESIAYYGVLMNLPDEMQAEAKALLKSYRESTPVRQRVESQFRDLDSLIQRVDAEIQEEEFRKLLERFDPSGPLN